MREKKEIQRSAYQRKNESRGILRFHETPEGAIVYRRVSGGKKTRYHYWLVCGTADIHGPQVQAARMCPKVKVAPINSAEERNIMRRVLGTVIHGPIVFADTA